MAEESASCGAAFGFSANGFSDAAVKSLDETVGLRPIRPGQAMVDHVAGAEEIERVLAGRTTGRLVLHIDRKAIGELGAVVGQDGMNPIWEVSEEPAEEARRSRGITPCMDLDIDVAGSAIDRDKGIAFTPLQSRQMLQIDMNEANGSLFKDADAGPVRLLALADRMALEAAMDGAAGELLVDATSYHLDDIVERQLQRGSQFAHQGLFDTERLVASLFGRCERSATVARPRQRRIVVSLTPSSPANSDTGFLLRWM